MSKFRRRLMGLSTLRPHIKDEFVRVEYIENTSNAYIDTGIIANQNTNYEIKVQFTKSTSYPYIFGAQQADRNRRFSLMEGSYNAFYYSANLHTQEINLSLTTAQQTSNLVVKKDGLNMYVDGKKKGTFSNATFTTPSTLTIFTCHLANGGVHNNTYKGRFYYFKLYDGTTLVRNFIPVLNKATDEYGMYDLVKKKFYTSPNGVKFTGGERYDTTDIIEVHPKLIANTYINENSGAQQNYDGWSSSDYIDVEGFKYIQVPYPFSKMNYKYGAYYDKDKNRISNTASLLTIPSNAKYVRLSTTTGGFTNVWLFKRQFTQSKAYQTNHYIETDGSIRAYNGWNIFNTESVYKYFYCWVYSQFYRYQASYNADGSVYQSGKGFLEKPKYGKVLLSDNHTSITYYAGYNYEYKNMNE